MSEDEESEDTQGVYGDGGREDLIGNDEISPEEDAFMSGYDSEEEKKEVVEDIYEKAFDATVGVKGKKGKAAKKPVKKAAAKKAKKSAKPKKKPAKKSTKKAAKKAKKPAKPKKAKPAKKSSKKAVKKAKKPAKPKKAKPAEKSKKKSKR